jgi:Flp pilus assembly protein TadG
MPEFRMPARMQKCLQPIQGLVRRLLGDNSGVAAIEFAFIAPLMFFMLVGTVEMSQAITVDRRVTVVASTVADLVAREQKLAKKDFDVVMQIVTVLMAPYEAGPLKVTLLAIGSKVGATLTDKNKICWFQAYPSTATVSYVVNQDYDLPLGIVDPGGSVIVAEVGYTYSPLIFSYFIQAAFPLTDKFYLKPRVSNFIPYDKTNSGNYVNRDTGPLSGPASCFWP